MRLRLKLNKQDSQLKKQNKKLSKIQKDSEEMLSKFEQAEQGRVLLEKHIEKAEKPIVFENKETDSDGDDECEHCHEEFQTKTSYKEHIHSCPICQTTFKEYPCCQSDHIHYNHEELFCENCNNYFTQMTQMEEHKKSCIRCERCYKTLKSISEIRKHNKKCLSKRLQKKFHAKSTDETDSEESSN